MSTQRDELLGQLVLGRYRIVRRLARGGMGVIFLARMEGAAGFVKPVVVKRVLPDLTGDDTMAQMFIREARILANLRHPGIVSVLDFAEEDGAYIMVLDYVHGYHLGRWHKYINDTRGSFPTTLALQISIRVLDALHYAHTLKRPDGKSLNIIHRDVSPSNVLLDAGGDVKLADFGIARMSGETEEYKTENVTLKGKLPYLAPELFIGDAPGVHSDVYACGVVLHELLTGRNEFRAKEMSETLARILRAAPTSVREVRKDVPESIDAVLLKALEKSPEDRFATAAEFAEALREIRGMSDEEANNVLAKEIQRDFYSDMPAVLRVEPLDVLDSAWRQERDDIPVPLLDEENEPRQTKVVLRPRGSDDPTAGASPMRSASEENSIPTMEEPRLRRRRKPYLAIAIIVISVLTATVLALLQSRNDSNAGGRRFILVERKPQTTRTTPAETDVRTVSEETVGARDATVRTESTADAAGEGDQTKTPRRRPVGADRLTRAFAQKQSRIEICFQTHAQDLSGAPQISVRFSIDESGAVTSAELTPPSLGQTELGRCILAVARSTEFGAQDEPLTFRIPITARRAP